MGGWGTPFFPRALEPLTRVTQSTHASDSVLRGKKHSARYFYRGVDYLPLRIVGFVDESSHGKVAAERP